MPFAKYGGVDSSKFLRSDGSFYIPDMRNVTVDEIRAMMQHVKTLRPRYMDATARVSIIYNFLDATLEERERLKKVPKGRRKLNYARALTVRRTGYSVTSISSAWSDFRKTAGVRDYEPPINRTARATRVSDSTKVISVVRMYVRARRSTMQFTTARQLLDHLVDQRLIEVATEAGPDGIERYTTTALRAAQRAVQRYLLRHGFKRGKQAGVKANYELRAHIREKRDIYLEILSDNDKLPYSDQWRHVYLDESYVNQRHHHLDLALFDPTDDVKNHPVWPRDGRRWCFAAAIIGPNPRCRGEPATPSDIAGVVAGTTWIFEPTTYKGKKAHTDYHKNFNGVNFLTWWNDQLLPNLPKQPCLIHMDNASYHLVKRDNTPVARALNKTGVIAALRFFFDVSQFDENIGVLQLKKLLRDYIATVPAECVRRAEKMGHKVIFTPPYHSDLQPIELVWAKVKGDVARSYTAETGMKDVRKGVVDGLAALEQGQSNLVGRIISHVDKCRAKFYAIKEADDKSDAESERNNGGSEVVPAAAAAAAAAVDATNSPVDEEVEALQLVEVGRDDGVVGGDCSGEDDSSGDDE